MRKICEPHGKLRCDECAWIEELKEEIERYKKELERIANLTGNPYNPQEAVIIAREAMQIAKNALK